MQTYNFETILWVTGQVFTFEMGIDYVEKGTQEHNMTTDRTK